jgi:protein-disulfide isomerase
MSRTPAVPRQDRRRLELEQRRQQRRRLREDRPSSPLRSPMVLFTVAALAVGAVVIAIALLAQPRPPTVADLIEPTESVPAGLADGRSLGRSDAPVTIEIWSDFQCPACRDLARRIEPPTVSTYVVGGTVRLEYHDAAFQGAHGDGTYDESVESAAASRCAADQGLFWQMHNWLFANWNGENEGAFKADRLRAIATGAGLDLTAYDTCMASGDKQTAAQSETSAALAAGVDQTPTLIVNGVTYVGAPNNFSDFAAVIEQAAQP